MAEVAVYPTVLAPTEIAAHYVASGRSLPGGVSPAELYGGGNLSEKCVQCFVSKFVNKTKTPVDVSTGNFWHTFDDLSVPGRGPTLDLSQTYNSLSAGTNGPFGYGWSYCMACH
jgi:hypothetical protein